jgi:transposase-like protein
VQYCIAKIVKTLYNLKETPKDNCQLSWHCRKDFDKINDVYWVKDTHIKVKGNRMYPHRAVDSKGGAIEFVLGQNRDAETAERYFKKP